MGSLRLTGASGVLAVVAGLLSAPQAGATTWESETMTVSPSTAGWVVRDRDASNGSALVLTSNGIATSSVSFPAAKGLVLRAKADLCSGSPNLTLSLDGEKITTVMIDGTSWANYTFTGVIPAGKHSISVEYSNHVQDAKCQRKLFLDTIRPMTTEFAEDFNGLAGQSVNTEFWTMKEGHGWDPGLETYSPSNVSLDGKGNLVLRADKTVKSGYTSGWIESKNKVSFGYGVVSARIKVPSGKGLWPAFWLKGADEDTHPWPECGEIDVVELPGTNTMLYSTLHGTIDGTTENRQAQTKAKVPDLSTGFHVFWVRRVPYLITIGVDDLTLTNFTPDSLKEGSQWVYNRPMQAILDLAIGGEWVGAPDDSTKFPATMLVDWLRWDPPEDD